MNYSTLTNSKDVVPYDDMMKIVESNSCFDYVDETTNNINTRTFIYRMGNTMTDEMFLQNGARNMRGTVYNRDTKEILALPFFKFFNIYENKHFTDYDEVKKWDIRSIFEKVDGCLIYFYSCNNKLICRTKGGSTNRESKIAMDIVNKNRFLRHFIEGLVAADYTPMFELISPINSLNIVEYNFVDLVFLGFRCIYTGQLFMNGSDLDFNRKQMQLITAIYPYYNDNFRTIDDVIEECFNRKVSREEVLEGYVIEFENEELVKFKYDQYLSLHKELDSITGELEIVDRIMRNTIDDIYIHFKNNKMILDMVNMIKQSVKDTWNDKLDIAKQFYNNNKELPKKDYYKLLNKEYDDKLIIGATIIYYDQNGHPDNFNKLLVPYRANREWRKSKYYTM